MIEIIINVSVGLLIAAVILAGVNKLSGGKLSAAYVDARKKMSEKLR